MLNDLRYAARVLLKNPAFALPAIVTLAAGIGFNVTVFCIINALLLRPLPVRDPARLVWVTGSSTGPDAVRSSLTYPDVVDLRDAGILGDVCAFNETRVALRAGEHTIVATGQLVTGNYFSVLGVSPVIGRPFSAADDLLGGQEPVAVVSSTLWRRLFDGRPDAIGAPIQINGQPFSIAGVAPPGFVGADVLSPPDIWIPLSMAGRVTPIRNPWDRDSWWLRGVGRLRDGMSARQARAALRALAGRIAGEHPTTHAGFSIRVKAVRGANLDGSDAFAVLALLPAVPVSVLLIACANVASLLLARGAGRAREIAVRRALGATRAQVVRQLLAESLLLAVIAGALSLLISLWAPDLLVRLAGAPNPTDLSPDLAVVVFTAAMSLATALVFGIIPADRMSRLSMDALRSDLDAAGSKPAGIRRLLVGGQMAVSLVLVVAAILFLESVSRAMRTHVGFETHNRVTLSLDLRMQRYSDERAGAFYRALLERASITPGIERITYAAFVPLGGRVMFMPYSPAGQGIGPTDRAMSTAVNMVGPSFFETLGLPIRRGRGITERDLGYVPSVVVINETMARRLSPGGNALGQRLALGEPGSPSVEVVGIAADAIVDEFGEAPRPVVYVPHDRRAGEIALIASTTLSPRRALEQLESAVHELNPSVAVFDATTMAQHVAERVDRERALFRMLSLTGVMALGLAAFGLYSNIAYAVTRRAREIGVRVALGAEPRDVVRLFVGQAIRLAVGGLAAGLVPAIVLTFLLSSVLFGVRPVDPVALVTAAAVLLCTATVASYAPARRALRVDPIEVLRTE